MNPTNPSINPQFSGVQFENIKETKTDSGATQFSGQVKLGSRTIDVTVLVSEEKLAALGDKLGKVVEKTALKTAQAFVLADISHKDVEKVTLKGEKLSIFQKGLAEHTVTDLKQLAEGASKQTNLTKETADLVNYCVKDIFNFPHVQPPPAKVEKKEVKKEEEVAEEFPDEVTDEDDLASVISGNPDYLDDLEGLLNDSLEGMASEQLLEAKFEPEKEEQPPVAQERRAPPPRPPRPELNVTPASAEEAQKPEVKARPEKPEPPSKAGRPQLPSRRNEPPPVPPRDELPVEVANSSETENTHETASAEKKEDLQVKDNPAEEAPAEPEEEELEAVASERAPAPPPPPPPPPTQTAATHPRIPPPPSRPPPSPTQNASPPESAATPLSSPNANQDLLAEIRGGKSLKKVEANTINKVQDETQLTEKEKMTLSMQKAMEARRAHMNMDNREEEEDDGAFDDEFKDKIP